MNIRIRITFFILILILDNSMFILILTTHCLSPRNFNRNVSVYQWSTRLGPTRADLVTTPPTKQYRHPRNPCTNHGNMMSSVYVASSSPLSTHPHSLQSKTYDVSNDRIPTALSCQVDYLNR